MEKKIELCKVRPGETFTLDGVEFVKLGEDLGDALVLTRDVVMKKVPFEDEERNDHNNYIGSNLEKQCVRWLRAEHPDIFKNAVERPIDLTTMDGMIDYGMPLALARALTIDEYRKYRIFIPLSSEPYWLATGWTTASSPSSDTNCAYCIDTGGSVNRDNVYYAYFAARPALYLRSSIFVSVDDGEAKEKGILAYKYSELVDELYRRSRETYDLDNWRCQK